MGNFFLIFYFIFIFYHQEVLALAPQEDYIRKHLGIVRSKLAKARDLKDLP